MTNQSIDFWVKAVKQNFSLTVKKFPSLLGHSCSNFSNKNKPLLPLLPLLYCPSCFSAQLEDKVQKQQPADNIFFRVHSKQIPCVDRMEKVI